VLSQYKKSHLDFLSKGHIPSPLHERSSFFDEQKPKVRTLDNHLRTEGDEFASPQYDDDSEIDLERMEEDCQNDYEEFLQNKVP
jgi:hypothetical protein